MYQSPTEQILRFESTAELGQYCLRHRIADHDAPLEWLGGINGETAAKLAISGDVKQVAQAEKLMAKLMQEIDAPVIVDVPSVAGCYPCVAEALMGEPESMREPEQCSNAYAPLTIVADVTSAAKLSAHQIEKRGIAILAFVMAQSAIRPVTLEVIVSLGSNYFNAIGDKFSIISAKINTTPLDLATAAYALTHAAFPRQLMYGLALKYFRFDGRFPLFDGVTGNVHSSNYCDKIKHYLNLDGDVLYIPPASKQCAALLNAPHLWLQEQLQRITQRQAA